ncbi:UPF0261 domain protein [Talaromyces stipitatus ATCC 10500]|uniref:UPF0261 domain protein n=1 Tax=Talaromyces stipitatus (strain ATCC 10500 / CBS 375.48 / QM 6759 / NRRL 1006) TaxID=441959 RepID=B8LW36_TALSN|nr:UPF0261 domain protein [Talaromyces stipitatus ATCC 10500]EED24064.1 UPF0261 domain protein [Talaromyces stipitatus ATCC 10500]
MAYPRIAVLGTCDTKLAETLFLRDQIIRSGEADVLLLDVGRTPVQNNYINISNSELASRKSADGPSSLAQMSRTEYIKYMIECATSLVTELFQKGEIHGIVSASGSSGTSLVTAVMRNALPVGFPKFMVSTMVSGDVSHLVEETDITLMYSVVDIAGTNAILNQILTNAAAAITGAATAYCRNGGTTLANVAAKQRKKRVAITMFGVTTPCVDAIREHLESNYAHEVYVFHATGSGGKAMERLIREKQLDAVLDITTTEIADELVGGVLSAGPQRLTAAAKAGIPQVISVGACDMVNFGPRDSVPTEFSSPGNKRLLYEHNPAVTLMRTTQEECTRIAEFIASKLRDQAVRPDLVKVILPTGGISMISTPSQPFYKPESDTALFDTLERHLEGSNIEVKRDDRAINDRGFALLAAELLVEVVRKKEAEEQSDNEFKCSYQYMYSIKEEKKMEMEMEMEMENMPWVI